MVNMKDVLFWVFLFIAMILIIWKVFGNSPNEFYITLTILVSLSLKLWSISEKLERHLGEGKYFKKSFMTLGQDFKEHVGKK